MVGNADPDFWSRARKHLVRYGGSFAPLIIERASIESADSTASPPPVEAEHGMVVTAQHLATKVGAGDRPVTPITINSVTISRSE